MSSKKSVLITGCSDGGMGAELALAFHRQGTWRVLATARNLSKTKDVQAAGIEVLVLDIASLESIKACVAETSRLLNGRLDMLINNAGSGYAMPFLDAQLDPMRAVFENNVFALVSVTQAFFPLLRAADRGVVVNHTSGAAEFGIPMQSVYNASKAAAAMLTRNLRMEVEALGVKVVDLRTGGVKTKFHVNLPDGAGTGEKILPENSVYAIAREAIENGLSGETFRPDSMDADVWATKVARSLSKSNVPDEIWQGSKVWWAQYLTWLPLSLFASTFKQISGLDVFEKKYAAQQKSTAGKKD